MDEKNDQKAQQGRVTQAAGLTEARKQVLAQHYAGTPANDKAALVALFREQAPPEERDFIEKIANSRN